jgi:peroxiredoxin
MPKDDFYQLPEGLPVPIDDGAANHLPGMPVPPLALQSTEGTTVNLARLPGRTVVYAYPRTGEPGRPTPAGWNEIPGARGCTPQSCAFRDHYHELQEAGANHVYGLSTQTTEYQREAAERLHLPFALLSDRDLALTRALSLPTFEFEGMTLLKRLTLVLSGRSIERVFYPVFPPDRNAEEVLSWLRGRDTVQCAR